MLNIFWVKISGATKAQVVAEENIYLKKVEYGLLGYKLICLKVETDFS